MLTITLTPELEKVITEKAELQGTTPELLTLESLNQMYASPVSETNSIGGATLADYLGDFVGCIHSSENIPGGAQMSTDSSKKFAEGMSKKRREGHL